MLVQSFLAGKAMTAWCAIERVCVRGSLVLPQGFFKGNSPIAWQTFRAHSVNGVVHLSANQQRSMGLISHIGAQEGLIV